MASLYRISWFFVLLFWVTSALAQQSVCPPNIGFESGTFANWHLFAGSNLSGRMDTSAVAAPLPGRHTLLLNTSPQILDPYAGFPINCPNGSSYTLMLGNAATGAQVDGASYTLKVPANANRFSLTYYYAMVLQNPQQNHTIFEQPAFSVNIVDLTPATGNTKPIYQSDLSCGVHVFSAQNGQLGFKDIGSGNDLIQYKEWSPVNLNFIGYAGHTIQLTFMAFDCTRSGHFGYAYFDFEENCKSPITGNNYCLNQTSSIMLTAPAGYQGYVWTPKENLKDTLGTDYTLKIDNPIPGKEYALMVKPFPNLGCEDTLYTTINPINELFELKVQQATIEGCKSEGVNLKDNAQITAGSTPSNMKLEYFTDAAGLIYLPDPRRVTEDGTYYIRGTNSAGCTDIKPVTVKLYPGPDLEVLQVPPVCKPATSNLTQYVKAATGSTVTYFTDIQLTKPVPNPTTIDKTGKYYVVATRSDIPCRTVKEVSLVVSELPVTKPIVLKGCPPQSLFAAINGNNTESSAGLTYQYFYDEAGTRKLTVDPTKMTISGTYYYQATNSYGCKSEISPIEVTIYPEPLFSVKDPAAVVFPQTVNLSTTHVPLTDANFTYWKDAQCTVKLENYEAVAETGTYYIKATNKTDCIIIHPVKVLVNAPPEANLVVANTFTPNGDGINDEFKPITQGALKVNFLKIFNRYGKLIFETKEVLDRWTGDYNGQPAPSGTYYWVFSCYDVYRKQSYTRTGQLTLIR